MAQQAPIEALYTRSNIQPTTQSQMRADALENTWGEVSRLADNLDNILENCQFFPDLNDLRAQAKELQECVLTYRHGIAAAQQLARSGEGWLQAIQSRLHQAISESHLASPDMAPSAGLPH